MNRWTATDSSNVIVVRIIDGTKNEGDVILIIYLPTYLLHGSVPTTNTNYNDYGGRCRDIIMFTGRSGQSYHGGDNEYTTIAKKRNVSQVVIIIC